MRLNTFLGTLSIRAHAVLILVGWGVPTQFSRLMQGKLLSFSSPWVTDWAFTVSMVTHCASSGNKAFSLKQKKTLQWKLFSKFFLIGSNILFMGRERKASWVWDAAMGMFALEQLSHCLTTCNISLCSWSRKARSTFLSEHMTLTKIRDMRRKDQPHISHPGTPHSECTSIYSRQV